MSTAVSASRNLPTIALASTLPNVAEAVVDRLKHVALDRLVSVKIVDVEKGPFDGLENASIIVSEPKVFCSKGLIKANRSPCLKWFQSTFAGVEALVEQGKGGRTNFLVTRAGGSMGIEIGQFILGYILSHERKHALCERAQSKKEWVHDAALYRPLSNVSLGILGLGDIGKDVARLAKGIGVGEVYGWKRGGESVDYVDETFVEMAPVLEKCDYIVSVLPSTMATRGLLDNGALASCSEKSPVFINCGRGDLIGESSIVEALDKNWISSAILDVFETEPLPKTSKLWAHPNVTITPHVSGMSHPENIAKLFCSNLRRYLESGNDELEHVMDWSKGY